MSTKQVIVMRTKFPDGKGGTKGIRRGKEIAQAGHAVFACLGQRLQRLNKWQRWLVSLILGLQDEFWEWLDASYAKVCCRADSEEELMDIYNQALDAGLEVHLITDSGKTEFKEPTCTCLAIGPDKVERINKITGRLRLL